MDEDMVEEMKFVLVLSLSYCNAANNNDLWASCILSWGDNIFEYLPNWTRRCNGSNELCWL